MLADAVAKSAPRAFLCSANAHGRDSAHQERRCYLFVRGRRDVDGRGGARLL